MAMLPNMDRDLENVIRQALGVAKAAGRDHPSHAVEPHTLIEEPEYMNTSDRGLKHVCPECATKYYDLKREVVACPRCGAKPLAEIDPKATQTARKTGQTTSRWYR
jgi:DNA-directed RNA polymerase subunit RPC12/RpoP